MPKKDNEDATKLFDREGSDNSDNSDNSLTKKASKGKDDTLVGINISGVASNVLTSNQSTSNKNDSLATNPIKPIKSNTDKYTGAVFQNRYKIIKELGRGGIGVVYLAEDLQVMSKPVVVKVLIDEQADDWLKSKFRQEVEALARINHPNVVSILDTGETVDKKPFLVMQFIEGVNLRSIITEKGLELEKVANILQQLGSALRATHDRGIYHRDLKPENIMLQKSGNDEIVRLIDFGIAKVVNSQAAESTKANLVVGTFTYMSPEQLSGNKVSAVSDIFSLGIIAYELLTGIKPFVVEEAENLAVLVFQLILKREQSTFAKPRDLRPEIPLEAEQILLKALSPKQEDRYQQADEFANELATALRLKNQQNNNQLEIPLQNSPEIPKSNTSLEIDTKASTSFPKQLAIGAMILIILLVGSVFVLPKIFKHQTLINNTNNTNNTNITKFENQLTYYLTVQRYRDGKPYKTPLRLDKEIIFQPFDRVKLFLTSEKTGHLYIFSESPLNTDNNAKNNTNNSNWNWNILFPIVDNNVSKILANNELQIPDKNEFYFDEQSGLEKVWLIWSENSISELEKLTKWNNNKSKGEIQDKNDVVLLENFINNNKRELVVEQEKTNKEYTVIRSNEKIIIYYIELRHE